MVVDESGKVRKISGKSLFGDAGGTTGPGGGGRCVT
jgi:hypothetical protein